MQQRRSRASRDTVASKREKVYGDGEEEADYECARPENLVSILVDILWVYFMEVPTVQKIRSRVALQPVKV